RSESGSTSCSISSGSGGRAGRLSRPEGGVMHEGTMTRRELLKRGGQGAAVLYAGSLLTATGAFGRSTADKVRWISPRGTLQVMDDFNLWVPIKMGYFKSLNLDVQM